jgi:hypothetical protein
LIINDVTLSEALMHFVAITWKVLFAFVPPPHIWNGKAAFIVALAMIGLCTAIVEQFATLLGCELNIDDSITAITLVALGTSLPDTFASMTAAKQSDSADSAIGNITGSNSVNVFLGLGLPWVIASMYFKFNLPDRKYIVPAGSLAFSVYVFLVVAIVCFIILILRRYVSKPYSIFISYHSSFKFFSSLVENWEVPKFQDISVVVFLSASGSCTLFFQFLMLLNNHRLPQVQATPRETNKIKLLEFE